MTDAHWIVLPEPARLHERLSLVMLPEERKPERGSVDLDSRSDWIFRYFDDAMAIGSAPPPGPQDDGALQC